MNHSSFRNVLWGGGFHAACNTVEIAQQSMFYTRDSSRKGHDCNLKLFLIAPCIKKKFFEM